MYRYRYSHSFTIHSTLQVFLLFFLPHIRHHKKEIIIIMRVATGTTSRLVFLCAGGLVSTMMHAADGALPPKSLIEQALLQKDLPDTGEQWMTMPNGMEYQPAADLSPLAQLHLRQLTSENTTMDAFEKIFADGTETYYDEYAQAWRALGFYIDCDYQDEGRRRSLQDAGDDERAGCSRFMLWAAVSYISFPLFSRCPWYSQSLSSSCSTDIFFFISFLFVCVRRFLIVFVQSVRG